MYQVSSVLEILYFCVEKMASINDYFDRYIINI